MIIKCVYPNRVIDETGGYDESVLITGKSYLVLGFEADSFRILAEDWEPALFHASRFKVIDSSIREDWAFEIGKDNELYFGPKEFLKPGFFEDVYLREQKACETFLKYLKKVGICMSSTAVKNGQQRLTIAGELKKRNNQEG